MYVGSKWTYAFVDPDSGQYSEAATFTVPTGLSTGGYPALAASPDLTKFAVSSMTGGHSAAGWIDSAGQFTSVTPTVTPGPFGGNAPSYNAIGFDKAGNFYYKQNAQGQRYTEVYRVAAGSTSDPQPVTLPAPGAADSGAVLLNSDGTLLFGCGGTPGGWLNADTWVMAIAPGTQIAKGAITRGKTGCPTMAAKDEVTLLPTANTAMVHDPVANSDGTKVAFMYDDPDRVKHNFPTMYIVGTDGHSQPTVVNLSESDAKKLTGATLLRWS